jgi:hypothetical protein
MYFSFIMGYFSNILVLIASRGMALAGFFCITRSNNGE